MLRFKPSTRLPLSTLLASLVFGFGQTTAAPTAYVTDPGNGVVSVIDAAANVVLGTIAVGDSPSQVTVTEDGSLAYVANTGSDSISVIDTTANRVVATVSVAAGPSAVAVTPDGGEVYVLAGGGVLQVLDAALIGGTSEAVIATLSSFSPLTRLHTSIAILPDGARVYAVSAGLLQVIETATHTVQTSLFVGDSPSRVALSPDGGRAYVTNSYGYAATDSGLSGQVVVVDTAIDKVIDTIPLLTLPGSIAVAPDGRHAYVASVSKFWNNGYGQGFLPDSHVAVIDLEVNEVDRWINVLGQPAGVAVHPDGSLVYVGVPSAGSLAVIDTGTGALVAPIESAEGLGGLAVSGAARPNPSAPPSADAGAVFLRGDCNDDGTIDIADPVANMEFQFLGIAELTCRDALDFNDDGVLEITDPIANLTYQFLGGPPPGFPGDMACGRDTTSDELSCETFGHCP